MNVSEQEFKFMVEGITSDLIQLLIDREQYTLPHAVDTVYGSNMPYCAPHLAYTLKVPAMFFR